MTNPKQANFSWLTHRDLLQPLDHAAANIARDDDPVAQEWGIACEAGVVRAWGTIPALSINHAGFYGCAMLQGGAPHAGAAALSRMQGRSAAGAPSAAQRSVSHRSG